MTINDIHLIAPELTLLVFALLVILLDLFVKRKVVLVIVSLLGIVISAGFALSMWGITPTDFFYSMLAIDQYTLFFKLLLLVAVALVILASQDYVSKFSQVPGRVLCLAVDLGNGNDAADRGHRPDFDLRLAGAKQYLIVCSGDIPERP